MKFIATAMIAFILAIFVTACGGEEASPGSEPASDSGSESVTVDVVMHDIYYGDAPDNAENPPAWTVPADAEVSLNLDNQGALEHNWAIVEPGSDIPVPFIEEEHSDIIMYDSGLVAGGESATVMIPDPLQPGEYQVICTVPGHYPAMQGRLVVTE